MSDTKWFWSVTCCPCAKLLFKLKAACFVIDLAKQEGVTSYALNTDPAAARILAGTGFDDSETPPPEEPAP